MIKEAETASSIASQIFGHELVGAYLYGSGVSGSLRPLSDIDVLVVIKRSMSSDERLSLTTSFLRTSGRYPNPPGKPRCLEVSVVLRSELAKASYPGRCEFLYGEWLRADLEQGIVPEPFSDPGVTLMLAQARIEAVPLTGPRLSDLVPPISAHYVRGAMRDAIPSLVTGLKGDERNVLLTLARMWRTAVTGEFVGKDTAANWAASQVPTDIGDILRLAGNAYLGNAVDDWSDRAAEAQRASDYLQKKVTDLLNRGPLLH
jgi:predicted nucleotidyltransferase